MGTVEGQRSFPAQAIEWATKQTVRTVDLFTTSDMHSVQALYFDGRSARAFKVQVILTARVLTVEGDGIKRQDAVDGLRVSEPLGAAPRLIKFPDGAHCEVSDHAALGALLDAGGHRDGLVVRLQKRWRWALVSVVIAVAAVAAGYRWGLPAVSEWIAYKLPDSALVQMGQSTLMILDKSVFAPSKLPPQRQHELGAAFERLYVADGIHTEHTINFRNGGRVGANALALPDGTIVVTDQLVKLAANDEEILAVLAHELGHLERRHSLRMLIQGSIVAAVMAWYIGDVSSIAAGLPTLLLQSRYSRDHEREADAYAAKLLRQNAISPKRLGDMLERLEKSHKPKGSVEACDDDVNLGDYLSSHPATRERIRAFENQ